MDDNPFMPYRRLRRVQRRQLRTSQTISFVVVCTLILTFAALLAWAVERIPQVTP